MSKIVIEKNLFCLPSTQTLLGTHVNGKANFMALDWLTRVNYQPAMLGSSMSPARCVSVVLGGGITIQLSGNRAFVPTERLGYKTETFTFVAILSYSLSFFLIQMVVLFWHRHLE
jgi:hypothetical protein